MVVAVADLGSISMVLDEDSEMVGSASMADFDNDSCDRYNKSWADDIIYL